jgi:hypothetical protein
VFGKEYWIYHRRPLDDARGNHRVEFDKQGFIEPVKITFKGVGSMPISRSK